jgi:hypothetical protein
LNNLNLFGSRSSSFVVFFDVLGFKCGASKLSTHLQLEKTRILERWRKMLIFNALRFIHPSMELLRFEILAKIERILAKILRHRAFPEGRKSLCGIAIRPLSHGKCTFVASPS